MKKIPLYLGQAHECAYLPGQMVRTAYVGPEAGMSLALYSLLAERGFRRSGDLVYRPYCPNCSACVPVRVPVAHFSPNRSQVRAWRRNADLVMCAKAAVFDEEHYRLFSRYLNSRHAEGGMASSTRNEYIEFLASDWAKTAFVEFRSDDVLLAVAVVDDLRDALSAVYTFYDPLFAERSLGTYAILWQIAEARRLGLKWLYLGYWISDCRKMAYKNRFRPFEALIAGHWLMCEKGEKIQP